MVTFQKHPKSGWMLIYLAEDFPTLNHQYLFLKNSINLTSAQKNFHPMIWGIRADQTKKCPHFVYGKWYSSWFLPLPQLQLLNSRCPPLLSMLTAVSSNSMVSKPCRAGEGDIVGAKHGVNCCPVFWWICRKESHKNPLSESLDLNIEGPRKYGELWDIWGLLRLELKWCSSVKHLDVICFSNNARDHNDVPSWHTLHLPNIQTTPKTSKNYIMCLNMIA